MSLLLVKYACINTFQTRCFILFTLTSFGTRRDESDCDKVPTLLIINLCEYITNISCTSSFICRLCRGNIIGLHQHAAINRPANLIIQFGQSAYILRRILPCQKRKAIRLDGLRDPVGNARLVVCAQHFQHLVKLAVN